MLRHAIVPGASFLWWLDLIATTLSFFGSLWMIIHCLKAPSPKSLSLKLIAALGCADFLYSISNVLSNFEPEDPFNNKLCIWEARLRQFSYMLTIFFSTCVAVAAYFSACPRVKFNKALFFYLSVAMGIAISYADITMIPKLFEPFSVISKGPLYCWFSYSIDTHASTNDKLFLAMTFDGLPVIFGLVASLLAYILAIKNVQRMSQGLLDESKVTIYRVLWYPGVLFLTFVPNSAMIIYAIYSEPPVWMVALHLYLLHSIGFNNALLYGIQTRLYRTNYEEEENKAREIEDEKRQESEYHSLTEDRSSLSKSLKEAIVC